MAPEYTEISSVSEGSIANIKAYLKIELNFLKLELNFALVKVNIRRHSCHSNILSGQYFI